LIYRYFIRDFNIGSVYFVFGLMLGFFGVSFGLIEWHNSIESGIAATTGAVMISVLPIILGFQLILNSITYDVANEPKDPLAKNLFYD